MVQNLRLASEPPLDKGTIPWLGHALEFGKDAATFLTRMKNKHGDIFTVQVAGRFVTVLLDPHSYDAVIWESSSKLDFSKYARILMDRMFNVKLPDYDQSAEKTMVKLHFQGESLGFLKNAMFYNLHAILLPNTNGLGRIWKEDGLFHFCYNTMFRAGYLTLYGNEPVQTNESTSQAQDRNHSLKVYYEFKKLDRFLIKMAHLTLSNTEKKEAASVKEHLWRLLSPEQVDSKTNRSSWLNSYRLHLQELGVDNNMQARVMLLQLWATQGNVGPAAFWLLLFLLKHPEAMAAVQGEAERVFKQNGREVSPLYQISQELLDNTPVFNSVLNETLRLTAASFLTREVLQDMQLKLADGREYSLRIDDRLCIFPYLSPQRDPEVYEEPEKFKYDRFLNPNGTEKKDFYKRGKKLKYYNMPWGAGYNICVGRFYAINSLKQFVFILLNSFHMELCDPEERTPAFDVSRYGFGMLHPERDVKIKYKLKI
ncbi:prostacyclin synthase [Latimeria chalumnae]|uniref:prostacyclin synthase n=1 Tax=Latimeria chalumnae TaxID=7897 RepID=UPI00313CFEBC